MNERARLTISHETRYRFSRPAPYGVFQVRLRPPSCALQTIESWETSIDGGRIELELEDHHGNHVALACLTPGVESVVIRAAGVVETENRTGVLGFTSGPPLWIYRRTTRLTAPGEAMRELARDHAGLSGEDISALHRLSHDVRTRMRYDQTQTDSATTAEDALKAGHGVCQDHAHVFIGVARLLGLTARYVGGYIRIDDRDQQDAGHAWAELHVPGLGWVGFDVSNGVAPDCRYVRVATGLDYAEAAPVTGLVFGGASSDLSVAVNVQQQ